MAPHCHVSPFCLLLHTVISGRTFRTYILRRDVPCQEGRVFLQVALNILTKLPVDPDPDVHSRSRGTDRT